MKRWLMLALFLFVCFSIEFLGNLFTGMSVFDWYEELKKPAWTPPGWIFGPVWTFLYVLIAISGWMVWDRIGWTQTMPYVIYAIQLFFNLIWSYLFFALENPLFGLVDIVLLWFAIRANFIAFRPISATAAYLLVPYWAWVTYATTLNLGIYLMN